ncbi:MAG: 1-(5-phosphoribosyl)-5-amino-4-imidazole-carboxylate carboxylase, partial [Clostridiales bacterium 43-6]
MDVYALLGEVKNGGVSIEQAAEKLKQLPYEDLGFARVDHHRKLRTGCAEVIFCQGKTAEQVAVIFSRLAEAGSNVLATRANEEQYQEVKKRIPRAVFHETAKTITLIVENVQKGLVAVCTGGTADIPVAEEAAITAEIFGARVERIYDVGVSGVHRLLHKIPQINEANA